MIRTATAHSRPVEGTRLAADADAEATFAESLSWVRAEAVRVAGRLPPSADFDADDLFQVGALAAWKLAGEWDCTRSKLRSFAALRRST